MFLHVWRQSYQYSDLLFQHEAALNLPNGELISLIIPTPHEFTVTSLPKLDLLHKVSTPVNTEYIGLVQPCADDWISANIYHQHIFFYQFILASRETAAEKLSKICFRSFRNISPLVCPPVKVDDFIFFTVKCSVCTFSVQTLLSLHKLIWRTCWQSSHWETLAFILSHISVQRMKSNIPSPFSSVFGLHQPPRKRSDSFALCSPARH